MSDNLTELRKSVVGKLEDYSRNKQKLAALRYEMESLSGVSLDEIIDAMNFGHGEIGTGSSVGHISNRTLHIALNYREEAARLTEQARSEVHNDFMALLLEVNRLEHYISLLESQDEQVIRMTYMDHRTNEEIAEALQIAPRTVREIRRHALDSLCEMYQFTSGIR